MEDDLQDRIRVSYELTLAEGERPESRAREIALEQTVELPDGCYPSEIEERIVGRVETLEPVGEGRWRAVLAYDALIVNDDLPQLLNLVFGNISLMRGIRLTALELPTGVRRGLPGPRLGIPGVRGLVGGAAHRPLLCAAVKPMGLTSEALAAICSQFARGGIDVIKDDHGLANQSSAPFAERVEACWGAVAQANAATGGNALYVPNVTAPLPALTERLDQARAVGCRGIMIAPLLVGLDTVRWIAQRYEFAIFAHPTFSGAFLDETHGIAPEVLYGQLFRLVGSDGVIYPNAGGRFPFTERVCDAINAALRDPLDGVRPAFPVAGGGVDVERVPYWIDRFGVDMVFLIGSSLYAQVDLEEASRRLVGRVREHCGG